MTPPSPFIVSLAVAIALLSPESIALGQEAQAPAQPPYAWQVGPVDLKLGDQALLKLPEGYRALGPADTQRALTQMGNFPSGAELALVASSRPSEAALWFVVIRYLDTGYVKDDDAKNWDADALLASIQEGTEQDNAKRKDMGIAPLTIKGWEEKPRYDQATNKVVWAISSSEESVTGVNYNTLALGRQGYISMNMVGNLADLPALKPHAETLLQNLSFVLGKRYVDFNSRTDQVAAVGLAALVAGAAAKTGLLAKLWALVVPILVVGKKLIAVIVIAVGALAARWWAKRRSAPTVG